MFDILIAPIASFKKKKTIVICFVFLIIYAPFLFAQKKVGINTTTPQFELDIRTDTASDGADLNIGNLTNNHFLRLFSGKDANQFSNPTIYWNSSDSLLLGHFGPGFTELGRLTPDGDLLLKQGGIGVGVESTSDLLEIEIDSSFTDVTTDQLYDDAPTVFLPINSSNILAQSFTTGVSGKFVGVEVKNLLKTGTQATFAQISVFDSAGPGVNLLGSTQVELCDPNDIDILEVCFTDFICPVPTISVDPGDVFFMTVQWVSGGPIFWGNVDSGYYPDGNMWFSENGDPFEEEPGIDFAFETFVGVPTTVRVPFLRATENGQFIIKDYILPTSNGEHMEVMTATEGGQIIWAEPKDNDWIINGNDMYNEDKFVGIGNTNPFTELHVSDKVGWSRITNESQINGDAIIQLTDDATQGLDHQWTIRRDGNDEGKLQWRHDNVPRLSMNANGFTGIGTSDPKSELHVKDPGFSYITLESGADQDAVLSFTDNTSSSIATHWTLRRDGGDGGKFKWRHGNLTRLAMTTDGWLGIGTTAPIGPLHIKGNTWTPLTIETSTNDPYLQLTNGITGAGSNSDWTIRLDASQGERLQWSYNGITQMTLLTDGRLGLGTPTIPSGYKMAVDGKVIAEEVRVQLSDAWPDYVFTPEYKLMSIEEVDASIQANGHLPGIPKADILEREGLDTGEMQRKMMEKIEELTLHIIQLNERIKTIESEKQSIKTNK